MHDQQETMLTELMSIDFAIIELNLYLDTHPNDQRAIEMYNMNVQKSKQIREQYEMLFGPLTARYSTSKKSWQWISNPWPWNKNFMNRIEG